MVSTASMIVTACGVAAVAFVIVVTDDMVGTPSVAVTTGDAPAVALVVAVVAPDITATGDVDSAVVVVIASHCWRGLCSGSNVRSFGNVMSDVMPDSGERYISSSTHSMQWWCRRRISSSGIR